MIWGVVGWPSCTLWAAREQVTRGVLCSLLILVTYCMFLFQSTLRYSQHVSGSAGPFNAAVDSWVCPGFGQYQPVSILPCRPPWGPTRGHETSAESQVPWVDIWAARMMQAVSSPFLFGVLAKDAVHMVVSQLQAALLLFILLPLPYPNLPALLHATLNLSSMRLWQKGSCYPGTPRRAKQGTTDIGHHNRRAKKTLCWINWTYPSWYWKYPIVRYSLVALQRLFRPLAAAMTAAVPAPGLMELPMRLQLCVGFVKWGFTYCTSAKILRGSISSSTYLHASHFASSFTMVYMLPACVVYCMEKQQQRRQQQHNNSITNDQLHQYRKIALAGRPMLQDSKRQSTARTHVLWHTKHCSWATKARKQGQALCYEGVAATLTVPDSMQHMKPLAARISLDTHHDSVSSAIRSHYCARLLDEACTDDQGLQQISVAELAIHPAAIDADGSIANAVLSHTVSMLQELIGQETAMEVISAAMEANKVAIVTGVLPVYEPVTKCLDVSVKVHTDESTLQQLSPVLSSSAEHWVLQQLATKLACKAAAAAASQPARVLAVCIPGCIQLLGNVFVLPAAANSDSGSPSNCSALVGSSSDMVALAQSLLAAVVERLPATQSSNTHLLQSSSYDAASASKQQQQQQPVIVVIGEKLCSKPPGSYPCVTAVAANHPTAAGFSPDNIGAGGNTSPSAFAIDAAVPAFDNGGSPAGPNLGVVCISPCCLAAGRPQQTLNLHLALSGNSQMQYAAADGVGSVLRTCRLVVFQHQQLLHDQEMILTNCISVTGFPPLTPGIIHLALLPSEAEQHTEAAAGPQHTGAPLLLTPLLVLPESAAVEMQGLWQQAAASVLTQAATQAAPPSAHGAFPISANHGQTQTPLVPARSNNAGGDEQARLHFKSQLQMAWHNVMSGLLSDIAFVVGPASCHGCARPGDGCIGGSSSGVKTSNVHLLLRQLLMHLASQRLWHTMQCVLDVACQYA